MPQNCYRALPVIEGHHVYLIMKSKGIRQTDIRALSVGDEVEGKLRAEYVEMWRGYLYAVFSRTIARINVTFA